MSGVFFTRQHTFYMFIPKYLECAPKPIPQTEQDRKHIMWTHAVRIDHTGRAVHVCVWTPQRWLLTSASRWRYIVSLWEGQEETLWDYGGIYLHVRMPTVGAQCTWTLSSEGAGRCQKCTGYRDTLHALASRESRRSTTKSDRTDSSNRTNFRYLTTPEKIDRLEGLHHENRKALRVAEGKANRCHGKTRCFPGWAQYVWPASNHGRRVACATRVSSKLLLKRVLATTERGYPSIPNLIPVTTYSGTYMEDLVPLSLFLPYSSIGKI